MMWCANRLSRTYVDYSPMMKIDHPRAVAFAAAATRSTINVQVREEALEFLRSIALAYLGRDGSPPEFLTAAPTPAGRRDFARRALAEAANAGSIEALNLLVDIELEDDQGASAVQWLEKAVERRNADAATRLADLLAKGSHGIPKDDERAEELRAKAKSMSPLDSVFLSESGFSGTIGGLRVSLGRDGRFVVQR